MSVLIGALPALSLFF